MTNKGSGETGYVLVVLAGTLFVLLGFAALAVDVGYMYSSRASSQRAADAAALAGAFTFTPAFVLAPQPATAQDRAMQTAVSNYVMARQIEVGEVTVNVDIPNRRVTVDIDRRENTLFGKVLGWVVADVRVRAIAEASSVQCPPCVKPWFIPNTLPTDIHNCVDLQSACDQGHVLIGPDHLASPWALREDSGVIGGEFRIKPGSPHDALSSGQFFAVNLVPGCDTGGNDYRCNIAYCDDADQATPCDCRLSSQVKCGDVYDVKTGNMIGPTSQGVEDFITEMGTVMPDVWDHFDFAAGVPVILRPDGSTGELSHQIAMAPVWDVCAMLPTLGTRCHFETGTTVSVGVVGFAILFIDGMQGNDVVAHVVGVVGCGTGPPQCTQTGPFAVPLRLVRTE